MALHIERKLDMLGACKSINGYAGEPGHKFGGHFAGAYRSAGERRWIVSIWDADKVTDYTVAVTDDAEADMQHVECIMRLSYRCIVNKQAVADALQSEIKAIFEAVR